MKAKIFVFSAALLVANLSLAQELYRYVDENGVTILNSMIPVEYVNKGYEILNANGEVVQTVLPVESVEREFVVDKSDRVLLSSYSSVREIQEHRNRKIESIKKEIANIETDKRVLGGQMEKEIAERERLLKISSDRDLSERQKNQLIDLRNQIRTMEDVARKLDAQLARRDENIEEIKSEYAVKIERFIELEEADISIQRGSGGEAQ